ncbi:MAG: Regulator of sigma D [Cellvibrionales bacterium UBA7375]|nr:MAG: Regulator of sigma D [Cellvibrionales bacterium UBA7375]
MRYRESIGLKLAGYFLLPFVSSAKSKKFHDKNINQCQLFQRFCQQLVDYISEGHFEIFEQLINEGHLFNDAEALASGKNFCPTFML